MPKCPTHLKQRYLEAGAWVGFCARRKELIDEGKTPREALDFAIAETEQMLEGYGVAKQEAAGVSGGASVADAGEPPVVSPAKKPRKKTTSPMPVKVSDVWSGWEPGQTNARDEMHWLYHALGMHEAGVEVTIQDSPSPGAWGEFKTYSRSLAAKQKFYDDWNNRWAPTKKELEETSRFRDDGRNVEEIITAIETDPELIKQIDKEQEEEQDEWE